MSPAPLVPTAALRSHCVPWGSCHSGALRPQGPSSLAPLDSSYPSFCSGSGALLSPSAPTSMMWTHFPNSGRIYALWRSRFLKPKGFAVMGKSTNNNTTTARLLGTEAWAVRLIGDWGEVVGWAGGLSWVPSEPSTLRGVRTNLSAQVSFTERQALQVEALAKTHGKALNWNSFFWRGCWAHWAGLCQKAIWALALVLT